MKPATYAPVYCSLYPSLAELCRQHGYTLAIHGSLQRDFDIICIPWINNVSKPHDVVNEICKAYAINNLFNEPVVKENGRLVYTLTYLDNCFFDLSFIPINIISFDNIDDAKIILHCLQRTNARDSHGKLENILDCCEKYENKIYKLIENSER